MGVVADSNVSSCEKTKSEQIEGVQDGNLNDTVKSTAPSPENVAGSENTKIGSSLIERYKSYTSYSRMVFDLKHIIPEGPQPRHSTSPPKHRKFIPSMQIDKEAWESYDGVFQNYASIGVDAVAASALHRYRQAHPERFTGPLKNKILYAYKGMLAAGGIPCAQGPPPPLHTYVELRTKRPQVGWLI